MIYRATIIAFFASLMSLGAQSFPEEQTNHQYYPLLRDADGACTLAVKVYVTGFPSPISGEDILSGDVGPSPYRTVVRLAGAMREGDAEAISALHEPDADDHLQMRFGGDQLTDIAEFRKGSDIFLAYCSWYGDYAKVLYVTVTVDGTGYPWVESLEPIADDYVISDDLNDRSFPDLLSNAIAEAQRQYGNVPCKVDGMQKMEIGIVAGDQAVITIGQDESGLHPVSLAAAIEVLDEAVDVQDYAGDDDRIRYLSELLSLYLADADASTIASKWWIPEGLGWSLEGNGIFDPYEWLSSSDDRIDLRCYGKLAAAGSQFLLLESKGRPLMLWVGEQGGEMVVSPAYPGGDEARSRGALTMFDSTVAAALLRMCQR